uniref:Uncharacterized protein n=1 Tax=Arion vulgaris TaxID=1028688 RepID=A0A0B6Y7E2_9EUPU
MVQYHFGTVSAETLKCSLHWRMEHEWAYPMSDDVDLVNQATSQPIKLTDLS